MKEIRYIDLFAGMGGIRIGFEQACQEKKILSKCVFTSEIKKSAIQVYEEYFQERVFGDITKIDNNTIPEFDILLAGFPCQSFSTAGTRRGLIDSRGTLFFEIERILKEKQPIGFILENVEGLVSHNNGKTFQRILSILEQLGYFVSWKILNSIDFSIPQNRKRVYIIGNRMKKISFESIPLYPKKNLSSILEHGLSVLKTPYTQKLLQKYTILELQGKAINDKRNGLNNIHSWDIGLKGEVTKKQKEILNQLICKRRYKKWALKKGIHWMDGMPLTLEEIQTFIPEKKEVLKRLLDDLVEKGYIVYEYPKKKIQIGSYTKRIYDETLEKGYNIVSGKLSFEIIKVLDPNQVAPTLVATDVSRIAVTDEKGIRHLTVKEGLRLFGYSDNYPLKSISYKDAFDLLGNTVVIPVIKEISHCLLKSIIF